MAYAKELGIKVNVNGQTLTAYPSNYIVQYTNHDNTPGVILHDAWQSYHEAAKFADSICAGRRAEPISVAEYYYVPGWGRVDP